MLADARPQPDRHHSSARHRARLILAQRRGGFVGGRLGWRLALRGTPIRYSPMQVGGHNRQLITPGHAAMPAECPAFSSSLCPCAHWLCRGQLGRSMWDSTGSRWRRLKSMFIMTIMSIWSLQAKPGTSMIPSSTTKVIMEAILPIITCLPMCFRSEPNQILPRCWTNGLCLPNGGVRHGVLKARQKAGRTAS